MAIVYSFHLLEERKITIMLDILIISIQAKAFMPQVQLSHITLPIIGICIWILIHALECMDTTKQEVRPYAPYRICRLILMEL